MGVAASEGDMSAMQTARSRIEINYNSSSYQDPNGKTIVTVLGSTGAQGGGVVRALLISKTGRYARNQKFPQPGGTAPGRVGL